MKLVFVGSMKFCYVIAGAFGVSGCSPMQAVLRDVAIVVQFWCAIEHLFVSLFLLQFFNNVFVENIRGRQRKYEAARSKRPHM